MPVDFDRDTLPVRPWFGHRSIPTKGKAMRLSGRLPRWLILGLMILVGVVVSWYWHQYGVVRGLGEALAIAGFLGFTIERWFREDFAEDVFYAGLGAVLKPEFKEELRWLTSFVWLAYNTQIKVQVHEIDGGFVRLTLSISKEIENISSDPQKIRGKISIDEWDIPGHRSKIEECGIILPDGTQRLVSQKRETPTHQSWETDEVTIDRGARVKAFSRSIEFRHINDMHVLASMTPAKDPVVELETSDGLAGEVSFTHRGKMVSEPFSKKALKGTYLPSQLMVVRWWPKH